MDVKKVRELGDEELENKLRDLSEEIFRTRIQKETGQLDQSGKVRSLRRDMARAKTVVRERELAKSRA